MLLGFGVWRLVFGVQGLGGLGFRLWGFRADPKPLTPSSRTLNRVTQPRH